MSESKGLNQRKVRNRYIVVVDSRGVKRLVGTNLWPDQVDNLIATSGSKTPIRDLFESE